MPDSAHDPQRHLRRNANTLSNLRNNSQTPAPVTTCEDEESVTPSTTLSSNSSLPSRSFDSCIMARVGDLDIPDLEQQEMTGSGNENANGGKTGRSRIEFTPSTFAQLPQASSVVASDPTSNQNGSFRSTAASFSLHQRTADSQGPSRTNGVHSHTHVQPRTQIENKSQFATVQTTVPRKFCPLVPNATVEKTKINSSMGAQSYVSPQATNTTQCPPSTVYYDSSPATAQMQTPSQPSQWKRATVNRRKPELPFSQPSQAKSPAYRSHQNSNPLVPNRNESFASMMQSNQNRQYPQQHGGSNSRVRTGSFASQHGHSPSHTSRPHQHSHHSHHRNASFANVRNTASTPGSPHTRPHPHHNQPHGSGGGNRSKPDCLKTLLRKKACLYESGTSAAVVNVTWLVGRELALKYGYFTRQHLQSGVHAVVAAQIDDKTNNITRTKVNRCMQIVLNSCFYYIIPRPDGTEENGDVFRKKFKETVADDSRCLEHLSAPWENLNMADAKHVIDNTEAIVPPSPKITKQVGSKGEKESKKKDEGSAPDAQKKRILLCFNDNVRSAEDVRRCHSEFIRDAALTSGLHLTAEEWKYFFSRREDDCSQTSGTMDSTTSGPNFTPPLRGKDGCDVPYLSLKVDIPEEVSKSLEFNNSIPLGKSADLLGQMTNNELNNFRTTWCCKKYDHDARLCRFAHVNENGGWLRRDPSKFDYCDQMCPNVGIIMDSDSNLNRCFVNACEHGVNCKFAHSQEELDYHPKRYKKKQCESLRGNGSHRHCCLLDICPNYHPNHSNTRHHRKRIDSSSRGGVVRTSCSDIDKDKYGVPEQAPVLYLKPAPSSAFEKSLQFPGLRELYRSNCAVHYASHVGNRNTEYCLFRNDCGLNETLFKPQGGTSSFSLYSD